MHVDISFKNQEGRLRTVFYDGVSRAYYSDQFPKQIVLSLKEDYSVRSYKPEDNLSNVPYVRMYDNVVKRSMKLRNISHMLHSIKRNRLILRMISSMDSGIHSSRDPVNILPIFGQP